MQKREAEWWSFLSKQGLNLKINENTQTPGSGDWCQPAAEHPPIHSHIPPQQDGAEGRGLACRACLSRACTKWGDLALHSNRLSFYCKFTEKTIKSRVKGLQPLSSASSFHLLKNTPRGVYFTVPGYIWMLLDMTDCNLHLVQFPWIPVMRNHQENERNWKRLAVGILLLKATAKRVCETYLFKRWPARELLSTCTSPSPQWELQVFAAFPGQALKSQQLHSSAPCVPAAGRRRRQGHVPEPF